MSNPVSAQQANNGRSPEADLIYQQYLSYYNDINTKIHNIDSLPYDQRNQPNVQQDRAKLAALQQQLYPIYAGDYANSNATLASFQNDCASIEAQVTAAYNDAIGGGSGIHDQIQQDYNNAQTTVTALNKQIAADQNNLNQLLDQQKALEKTIADLQAQINALPDGEQKTQAQKDLDAANSTLSILKNDIAAAQSQLANLQTMVSSMTAPGGTLDQLKQLADKQNPTQADLDQANALLGTVNAANNYEKSTLQASLAKANADIAAVNTAISIVQKDLLPDPTLHDQIQQDYSNAQTSANALNSQIAADQANLNNLQNQQKALEKTIADLQAQINALPDGDQKKQAQKDLDAANAALSILNTDIAAAQSQLAMLQSMLSTITAPGGTLDQLQQLSNKPNPTQADLDQANALLGSVTTANNYEQSTLQPSLTKANSDIAAVNNAIALVQKDLNPPNPGTIENGCWYIDWTSWGFGGYPVPQGVNDVNIFVGNMSLDANGKPVIGGFGAMSEESMNAFIQACHAQGISVKLSIGGSTSGMYGRCWDVLTKDNVDSFAQALVDYCHTHGADGVDFDFEEFSSATDHPEIQTLVGTLIKDFKNKDPKLQTSLCTNAGFGPYFPWQGIVENVLNAASTTDPTTGKVSCAVDRMYIMSYYNTLSDEETWVTGWANWLGSTYNFTPAQISVGLDDTDAHAYDIEAFAAWAASQGFSTCYWEWDPNTAAQSDQSTNKIKKAYDANTGTVDIAQSTKSNKKSGEGKVKFSNYWYAEFILPKEETEPKKPLLDLLPNFVHESAV